MTAREELKARMIAQLGFDAETGAWIDETLRRMPHTEVEEELEFFTNYHCAGDCGMQGSGYQHGQ